MKFEWIDDSRVRDWRGFSRPMPTSWMTRVRWRSRAWVELGGCARHFV